MGKEKRLKIVFSTGAGISAESGVSTFRDSGGLWENHDVMEVASAEGYALNPEKVHEFYNARRRQLLEVKPNDAHRLIAALQDDERFEVKVITQNVDDLHERAGSRDVLHLHGELMKIRSVTDPEYIEKLSRDNIEIGYGYRGKNGDLMRPHIVFFNEPVPMITEAMVEAESADIFVVIGTSLAVYPAAGLINCCKAEAKIYYIDLNPATVCGVENLKVIEGKASDGVRQLLTELGVKCEK